MNILSAASELFPIIKTGGLADVTGALPAAFAALGMSTRTLIPGYPQVLNAVPDLKHETDLLVIDERASILSGRHDGVDLLILHCPSLFNREGGPYIDQYGVDYIDNWKRFAALSFATAKVAEGLVHGWRPNVVHLHDWQTGLAAAYLKAAKVTAPVTFTIHNLAFQGQFPAEVFGALQLPVEFYSTEYLEYYGGISFLKAGINFADAITTVSPTYAREILTEDLGMGMQGVLSARQHALKGIVNGIDTNVWDPSSDPLIAMNYDSRTLGRRALNKRALEDRFGLANDQGPILAVVSRLTWQKGVDLLEPLLAGITDRGGRLIVYGQGDPSLVHSLAAASSQFPGAVIVHNGFDEADAHLLHAGCDMIVQPSRFEPCGLTQLYALRYGAIPIVARTGGLAETIIDANEAAVGAGAATGFQFQPGSSGDLYHAIDRALVAFALPSFWRRLQIQAMKADFSWTRSAFQYAEIYTGMLEARSTQQAPVRAPITAKMLNVRSGAQMRNRPMPLAERLQRLVANVPSVA